MKLTPIDSIPYTIIPVSLLPVPTPQEQYRLGSSAARSWLFYPRTFTEIRRMYEAALSTYPEGDAYRQGFLDAFLSHIHPWTRFVLRHRGAC